MSLIIYTLRLDAIRFEIMKRDTHGFNFVGLAYEFVFMMANARNSYAPNPINY